MNNECDFVFTDQFQYNWQIEIVLISSFVSIMKSIYCTFDRFTAFLDNLMYSSEYSSSY